jgi:hypothetical protein
LNTCFTICCSRSWSPSRFAAAITSKWGSAFLKKHLRLVEVKAWYDTSRRRPLCSFVRQWQQHLRSGCHVWPADCRKRRCSFSEQQYGQLCLCNVHGAAGWGVALVLVFGRQVGGSAKVPVTGTLPELGQSRSAGLSPPKWHFAGTWAARHDPRTISQLMQKRFTFVNVAPAIWRWRWHWYWCCRL